MTATGLAVAALLCGSPMLTQSDADKKAEAARIQAEREEAFAKRFSGVTLTGRFTVKGRKDDALPSPERYDIESVRKLKNGKWMFTARIKYGKWDLKAPIPLTVKWAGDTPVISEDNFSIIGMGSGFRCRVIFDGDQYVGTWSHNKVGGQMFGRIDKTKPAKKDAEEKADNAK